MRYPLRSFIFLLTFVPVAASSPPNTPDPAVIIQRSVEALHRDWQAAPQFVHIERDLEGNGWKTYQVLMIEGSPYQKLIAVNGKPLSPEDANDEEQKLRHTVAERCGESPAERQKRISDYEAGEKRDHAMIAELTRAFTFRVTGQQRIDGHQTWVLSATPKPGYQPPSLETKALTGMDGKLWIDTATFEWVRVQAHVIRPVSIGGFLATVEPGTIFRLVRAPVSKGVWAPAHFSERANARILGIIGHSTHSDETYTDYQNVSAVKIPACPSQ
ncbi:MAG TPA: hypothetical protein VHC90_12525 [Bryobacteraceae bacterium]|nr:hypothetical protein [Bryobacteraceae bacterium]